LVKLFVDGRVIIETDPKEFVFSVYWLD
jgi:hypothetical protein